eukprot:CAMPEP_0181066886 /NCGR_PEP_ID=MMETSP1070-20121207/25575_1 /TAXON_ID=265543 /ORGANISM="Minutocellus polymorphus, Strain NH13" /LENGTH=49 /DNA_ID= /DNA_START= /DNA_END= /DNA_ORIENTATION=
MEFILDFESLTTPQNLLFVAAGMAIFWGVVLEVSKKAIYNSPHNPGGRV